MKLLYDDGEKENIRYCYRSMRDEGYAGLFDDADTERTYGLTFKVTDTAIAEFVLAGLLYDKLKDFDIGIKVQSIEFGLVQNKEDIKQKLHQAIENILEVR